MWVGVGELVAVCLACFSAGVGVGVLVGVVVFRTVLAVPPPGGDRRRGQRSGR
jgi:hypothetical protein